MTRSPWRLFLAGFLVVIGVVAILAALDMEIETGSLVFGPFLLTFGFSAIMSAIGLCIQPKPRAPKTPQQQLQMYGWLTLALFGIWLLAKIVTWGR